MFDLLIKNATIVDGTGKPKVPGSVASENGKLIVLPADYTGEAKRIIDGTGLFVSPGFIDVHSHGDMLLGDRFGSLSKISQGITTHVTGNCGYSMFPINPTNLQQFQESLAVLAGEPPKEMEDFTSFKNYRKYVENQKFPENIKVLAGHVALRIAAMGFENRKPTHAELENMKSMLREAMENGAAGFSTGLIYIPSVYAEIDEITELAKVAAEYGGYYTTHIRNEGSAVCNAVDEAIETARRSGIKLLISHHKIAGKPNWGLSEKTLQKVEQANASGIDVSCDQYPYTAGMSHLNICIPPKYFTRGLTGMLEYLKNPETRAQIKREIAQNEGNFDSWILACGGYDGILIAKAPYTPEIEGKRIGEYAELFGIDPADVLFDVLIQNNGLVLAIYFSMGEEDLFRIIQNKHVIVGSDGILKSENDLTHPRGFGTFTHAINYFVKEKHLLSLEQMIHKMTLQSAEATLIKNKGVIRDGCDADLVVFNYDTIKDTATYTDSNRVSDGIEFVIVGGEVVYENKKLTGANPGKLLLHQAP